MKYEVWIKPREGQTLFVSKLLGIFDTKEEANEWSYFEYLDDPATDKSEYYTIEVMEKK